MEEQTGREVDALNIDPPPPEVHHLWQWFIELSAQRGSGLAPNPISFMEIAAWAALTHRRPTPWEVGVICELDKTFLRVMAKQQEGKRRG